MRHHNRNNRSSSRGSRDSIDGAVPGPPRGTDRGGMSHDSLYEELQNEKQRRDVLERRSQELQRENRMLRRSHESR